MDTQLLLEDEQNRRFALEPRSFIVEAPAGAGKTELLTQRALKLLSLVNEPEEVVAITFTVKAASEMKHRILDSLEMAGRGIEPLESHKKVTFHLAKAVLAVSDARGWEITGNPGRLRILTIDALCSSLARQMPLLSRFGTQPRVTEDATRYYEEAARRTLALLEEEGSGEIGQTVADALRYLNNDALRLRQLLAEMLARRDQWLRHAVGCGEETTAAAEYGLQVLVERDIEQVGKYFSSEIQFALMPAARFAAHNAPSAPASPLAALAHWDTLLTGHLNELPLWMGLAELLLTQDGEFRKTLTKNQGLPAGKEAEPYKKTIKETLQHLPAEAAQALGQIRHLPDPSDTEDEGRTITALAKLLKLAAGNLWSVFNEAGEADFIEVAQRALQALGGDDVPTDLALRLDYTIQHLLVDEFQDTSPTQITLLQRLTAGWEVTDGRTLFLVGDPMQSIYRFRKADVGLFLRAGDTGIGQVALERLRLCRNNRSCDEVVDWVNKAFLSVFPLADNVTEGAIRYRASVATRSPLTNAGVFVEPLALSKYLPQEEAERIEANRVLDIIEAVRNDDPTRKIAVLVRARDHLSALVSEIRRRRPDLHFQAIEIDRLAERQPIQDLLALTRALHHRADRINWLAILRAPWCGLTLNDLYALAGDNHISTLWALMNEKDCEQRLSEDGRRRLAHVRLVIGEAFNYHGRQRPRRWVEGVWLMLGGVQTLQSHAEATDVKAFFDLIDKLDAAGRFSPDELEKKMGALFAAPDAAANGTLQFMTIHKSKGLEFDTVILPGLHRRGRGEDNELILWEEVALDGVEECLVAAPYKKRGKKDGVERSPYDYLRRLDSRRAGNETARVLYVAVTRAIRALYLVGTTNVKSTGDLTVASGSFLSLLWPAVRGEFETAAASPIKDGQAVKRNLAFAARLRRLINPVVPGILVRPGEVPKEVEFEL